MQYIALFFPAILSVGIEYKKNGGNLWSRFDYIYKYIGFLISNVLLTESLIIYVFKLGTVTVDAFNSFGFFTKYLLIASTLAIILPYLCRISRIIRDNISISFEIQKDTTTRIDSK